MTGFSFTRQTERKPNLWSSVTKPFLFMSHTATRDKGHNALSRAKVSKGVFVCVWAERVCVLSISARRGLSGPWFTFTQVTLTDQSKHWRVCVLYPKRICLFSCTYTLTCSDKDLYEHTCDYVQGFSQLPGLFDLNLRGNTRRRVDLVKKAHMFLHGVPVRNGTSKIPWISQGELFNPSVDNGKSMVKQHTYKHARQGEVYQRSSLEAHSNSGGSAKIDSSGGAIYLRWQLFITLYIRPLCKSGNEKPFV